MSTTSCCLTCWNWIPRNHRNESGTCRSRDLEMTAITGPHDTCWYYNHCSFIVNKGDDDIRTRDISLSLPRKGAKRCRKGAKR